MQSAYDRDDYVTIHWENISSGLESNFEKYTSSEVSHFNTTYDYDSILHYSAYGFSKNGKPTIVPVVSFWPFANGLANFNIKLNLGYFCRQDESKLNAIGQRIKMSDKDIWKLNAMYECNGNPNT